MVGLSLAPAANAQQGSCDPNYSGACVPIDSDVDCAGGSGNGPSYVAGPVQVIGNDIYGLDRDGDGTGCDK
jgi:resuscitation-promoting factor RpfB